MMTQQVRLLRIHLFAVLYSSSSTVSVFMYINCAQLALNPIINVGVLLLLREKQIPWIWAASFPRTGRSRVGPLIRRFDK